MALPLAAGIGVRGTMELPRRTTAFGPFAAAPLGLHGMTVLLWDTGAAGFLLARNS